MRRSAKIRAVLQTIKTAREKSSSQAYRTELQEFQVDQRKNIDYDLDKELVSETLFDRKKKSEENIKDKAYFPSVDEKRSRVKPYSIHPYFIEIKKQFNNSSEARSNRNNIFMPLKSAQMKIRPRSGTNNPTQTITRRSSWVWSRRRNWLRIRKQWEADRWRRGRNSRSIHGSSRMKTHLNSEPSNTINYG